MISFWMIWGVATTIFAEPYSSFLFFLLTSPVKTITSSIFVNFFIVLACCSTKGFVGAKNSILPSFFSKTSTSTKIAIMVLPRPVGKTTSVLPLRALFAMLTWYSLSSTAFSLSRGCEIYTGMYHKERFKFNAT